MSVLLKICLNPPQERATTRDVVSSNWENVSRFQKLGATCAPLVHILDFNFFIWFAWAMHSQVNAAFSGWMGHEH